MTDWIIETGVEIPARKRSNRSHSGNSPLSPIGAAIKGMKVGESLFTASHSPSSVRALVHGRKRRNPEDFVTREMGGGIRVWRLK